MRIEIYCEANESATNIGIAKALIESHLSSEDLKEIIEYLKIFCKTHTKYENMEAGK